MCSFNRSFKVFECIDHKLLKEKLYGYGFDKNSLHLIHSYLKGQGQKTKINSYSAFAKIIFDTPQCPLLQPLLFKIYK